MSEGATDACTMVTSKSSVKTTGTRFVSHRAVMYDFTAGLRAVPPETTTRGVDTTPCSTCFRSRDITHLAVRSGSPMASIQAWSMAFRVKVDRQTPMSSGLCSLMLISKRDSASLAFWGRNTPRSCSSSAGGAGKPLSRKY